jgi:hypothetical protein
MGYHSFSYAPAVISGACHAYAAHSLQGSEEFDEFLCSAGQAITMAFFK